MSEWNCNSCTFKNAALDSACIICGTSKAGGVQDAEMQRALAASLACNVRQKPKIDDQRLIDEWIVANNLNEYGEPIGTIYLGGSPLFNEATFEYTERLDYIRSQHLDQPWLNAPCNDKKMIPESPTISEIEFEDANPNDGFLKVDEKHKSNMKAPTMSPNISMGSDGWDTAQNEKDDWSEDDDLEDWMEPDEPKLNEKTIKKLQWQCVKCASFNVNFALQCLTCSEDRNPSIHCDICDVPVPFMCYEPHIKSHEKCGHKSPISIAFSIISILRNQTTGIPTVVCWDFAVAFVRKFFKIAKNRGVKLATPTIIYHWTPEKNINLIVDGNLKVPDGRNVLHQTDEGYYGKGVYTSPDPNYGRSYGHGHSKTIMCLAVCGKQYKASYPESMGKPLTEGYDMHVSKDRGNNEWVFFDNDQLLPAFVIEPERIAEVQHVVDVVARELVTSYREVVHGANVEKKMELQASMKKNAGINEKS